MLNLLKLKLKGTKTQRREFHYKKIIVSLILITCPLFCSREELLYSTLEPTNIKQHLSLYSLYPNTPAGKKALNDAIGLLTRYCPSPVAFPRDLKPMIALLEPGATESLPELNQELVTAIKAAANHLENRKLKGYHAKTIDEVLKLDADEIDLAHALLIEDPKQQTYEAMLDLMALQALARLPKNPTPEDKIEALNQLIFYDMRFRFPPHSLYVENIDRYTFLSSVLDSRQGVCLGVSILYLSLAERIGLNLEMVTPPGHIYIRHTVNGRHINIETTCRGIHIDDAHYLGVNTCKLEERTLKEVIGLSHVNEASIYLQNKNYEKAKTCYAKARPFLEQDTTIDLLQGYCYLLQDQVDEGKKLLKKYLDTPDPYSVSPDALAEDLFNGACDKHCLEAVLMPVNETRPSILEKKRVLEEALQSHPQFRSGWFSLGIAYLQLHRHKEALSAFLKFHSLTQEDISCEYYLCHLFAERLDYKQAWKHFEIAEKLALSKGHRPKALKMSKRALMQLAPTFDDNALSAK